MKKIILTGGAGFIGSQMLRHLNENGMTDVYIFDDITQEKLKNINQYTFSDYYHKEDLTSFLESIQDSTDWFCIHLGAESSTVYKERDIIDKNSDFTVDLISTCQQKGIPMIYASSASVYGNKQDGSYEPLNLYAFSKMLVDKWVQKHFPNPVVPLFGLRFFNVVDSGSGHNAEHHKGGQASVVYNWRKTLQCESVISVFKGWNKRDFISVDDVCNIMLHIMNNKINSGIYDIGTGKTSDFMEIAEIFQKRYGCGCAILRVDMPDEIRNQYQFCTQANVPEFLSNFKFTPLHKLVNDYLDKLDRTMKLKYT